MASDTNDRFPFGEVISLRGTRQRYMLVRRIGAVDTNACRCPLCGGLAMPWGGWIHCDGDMHCLAITFIETGEVLLPVHFKETPCLTT